MSDRTPPASSSTTFYGGDSVIHRVSVNAAPLPRPGWGAALVAPPRVTFLVLVVVVLAAAAAAAAAAAGCRSLCVASLPMARVRPDRVNSLPAGSERDNGVSRYSAGS